MSDIDAELDPWLAEQVRDDGTDNEFTNCECPRCGQELLHSGIDVVGQNGTEYVHIADAPNGVYCYCPDCWRERRAVVQRRENTTLADFGGNG